MEFLVSLIRTHGVQTESAKKALLDNCTHVDGDFYLYEGDVDFLGAEFTVLGEGVVNSLGGMSKRQLRDLCWSIFGIDVGQYTVNAEADSAATATASMEQVAGQQQHKQARHE